MREPLISNAFKTVRRSPSATALLLLCAQALVVTAGLHVMVALGRAHGVVLNPAVMVVAGLCLLASITWWIVARPFEAALRESRRTLRSLFVENPESIAMYGLDGRILRGNQAAADMMKQPAEVLIGAHFTKHVAPELVEVAHEAFEEAARGGTVTLETVFVGANAERIDVRSTLFPHVVDARIVGVFGVAKDISDLKRANAAFQEQSGRIHELYEVSASSGRSWKEQIDDALSLACRRLDFAGAFLVEVVEDDARMLAGVEEGILGEAIFAKGTPAPLDHRSLQLAAASSDVVTDLQSRDGAHHIVAAPVRLGDAPAGVVALVSRSLQERPLGVGDRDFIRLVTSLIASALQRGRQQERLDQLAFFDALTGLPNRVMVTDRLAELLSSAKWRGRAFAVHYVDLDRFKQVNDGYGHATGDRILRMAARRMQDAIGSGDMVARLGGDEFVIVQPLPHTHEDAKALAHRILATIAQPFCVDDICHQLGVSIGISISPNNGRDSQTLLQRADEALYRAKREGRNRLEFAFEDGTTQTAAAPANAA